MFRVVINRRVRLPYRFFMFEGGSVDMKSDLHNGVLREKSFNVFRIYSKFFGTKPKFVKKLTTLRYKYIQYAKQNVKNFKCIYVLIKLFNNKKGTLKFLARNLNRTNWPQNKFWKILNRSVSWKVAKEAIKMRLFFQYLKVKKGRFLKILNWAMRPGVTKKGIKALLFFEYIKNIQRKFKLQDIKGTDYLRFLWGTDFFFLIKKLKILKKKNSFRQPGLKKTKMSQRIQKKNEWVKEALEVRSQLLEPQIKKYFKKILRLRWQQKNKKYLSILWRVRRYHRPFRRLKPKWGFFQYFLYKDKKNFFRMKFRRLSSYPGMLFSKKFVWANRQVLPFVKNNVLKPFLSYIVSSYIFFRTPYSYWPKKQKKVRKRSLPEKRLNFFRLVINPRFFQNTKLLRSFFKNIFLNRLYVKKKLQNKKLFVAKKLRKFIPNQNKWVWSFFYKWFSCSKIVNVIRSKKFKGKSFFYKKKFKKHLNYGFKVSLWRRRWKSKQFFLLKKTSPELHKKILSYERVNSLNNKRYWFRGIFAKSRRTNTRLCRIIQPYRLKKKSYSGLWNTISLTRKVLKIAQKIIMRAFFWFFKTGLNRATEVSIKNTWKQIYCDRNIDYLVTIRKNLQLFKPFCVVKRSHKFFKKKIFRHTTVSSFWSANNLQIEKHFLPTNFKNRLLRFWLSKMSKFRQDKINNNVDENSGFKKILLAVDKITTRSIHDKRMKFFLTRWVLMRRTFFDKFTFAKLKFLLNPSYFFCLSKRKKKKIINFKHRKLPTNRNRIFFFKKLVYTHDQFLRRFTGLLYGNKTKTNYHFCNIFWLDTIAQKFIIQKQPSRFTSRRFFFQEFFKLKKLLNVFFKHRNYFYRRTFVAKDANYYKTRWGKKKFYYFIRKLCPAEGWFKWKLTLKSPRWTTLFNVNRKIVSMSPWLETIFFKNKLYLLKAHFFFQRAKNVASTKKYFLKFSTENLFSLKPQRIMEDVVTSRVLKRLNLFYFSIKQKYLFKKVRLHSIRNTYRFVARESFPYHYFSSLLPSSVYQLNFAPTIFWSLTYVDTGFIFCADLTKIFTKP